MVQRNIPFSVSRNDGRPLVAQVADGLRQAIVAGFYWPGDVVPPSRDLAPKLGVSRIVTKAALAQLSAEGLVVARPRIGTVVRDRNVKQWKGRVIFACPEGDENYAQTVLAGTLRNRLTEAGYLFTQVCLPQKARDRYDFARLDAALSQSADIYLVFHST